MGVMRFQVHPPGRVSQEDVQRLYLVGPDQVPWRRHVQGAGETLLVERAVADSCNLWVPWQVEGRGKLMLSTATLMERAGTYHLGVELARGTINQLRSQAYDWVGAGLALPEEFPAQLKRAIAQLSLAV